MYILNNGTLPTVCGLLRSKPTGRNVTVNVSFEAGDMAGLCSFIMFTLWDRFLHRLLSGHPGGSNLSLVRQNLE